MAIVIVPVLVAISTAVIAVAKWMLEFIILYGKKIAFYAIAVGLFFSALYIVSSALFLIVDSAGASSYFSSVAPYLTLATAILPSNFLAISALVISIEFQIFVLRWSMKVIDLKVDFFS